MKKKTGIAVLAAVIGLFAAVGAGCAENSSKQEAVFGVGSDLEASINAVYELPVVVVTIGGQEYVTDVLIKDSEGKEVPVSNNSFFVDSFDGYTAVFSISVGGVTYEKQVEIKVGDLIAPVLKLDTPDYVTVSVGETFVVPADKITATDNSGEKVNISYSVKFGETQVELSKENTFRVGEIGEYVVTITARDTKGNTTEKTIVVEGRERGLIADFEKAREVNAAESLFSMAVISQNTDLKYIRSGSGSLKAAMNHTSETWPGIILKNLDSVSLEDSVSFSLWVYNESNSFIKVGLQRSTSDEGLFVLKPHCWNYLEVKAADYDKVFVDMDAEQNGLPAVGNKNGIRSFILTYTYLPEMGAVNLYLDDIRINYEEPERLNYNLNAEFESGEVGKEYIIPTISSDETGAEIEYTLYAPDHKVFAVRDGKFTPDAAGVYVVAATVKDENGEGWNAWTFKVIERKQVNVLYNFEDAGDAEEIDAGAAKIEWTGDSLAHEGTGAAKITVADKTLTVNANGLTEKIAEMKESGYDCISFYVYINKKAKEGEKFIVSALKDGEETEIGAREWRRVTADLKDAPDFLFAVRSSIERNLSCDVYLDNVIFAKRADMEEEERFSSLIEDFENCDVSMTIDNKGCVSSDLTTTAHSGELALYLQSGLPYGMFSIRALDSRYSSARRNGYNMISLWVYADDTDATTYCVWDSWNRKLSYKIPAKTWTNVVFDISDTKGTYQFMSLTAEDNHANLKFIVDDVEFIRSGDEPFDATYATFEDGDVSKVDGMGCTAFEIGNVAHGGEKSLKLNSVYTYSKFTFHGLDDKLKEAIEEGYTKIGFWIYVESEADTTYYIWDLWNSKALEIKPKTWRNVVFDITGVQNYATLQFMCLTEANETANLTFYIDDIAFTNEGAEMPPEPFDVTYATFEDGDVSKVDGMGCTAFEIGNVAHGGEKSLKLNSVYTYSKFTFHGLDDKLKEAIEEGYTKIGFWIYVESEADTTYYIWDLWNSKALEIKPKTWRNVVFDITGVQNYATLQFMCLTEANETANLTFYIDDIAFTNEGAEMPENSDSDKPG